jgi:hypothetical protein
MTEGQTEIGDIIIVTKMHSLRVLRSYNIQELYCSTRLQEFHSWFVTGYVRYGTMTLCTSNPVPWYLEPKRDNLRA